MNSFSARTTGKWILAGEHAVLRGCPALVFPLASRVLQLDYSAAGDQEELHLELKGRNGRELEVLFWGVLEKACALKKYPRSCFHGHVRIESGIPVGAGLGASAALCVAMSRWFAFLKMIDEVEVAEFARTLENLFHGESSGVDIAVAMRSEPLRFQRGHEPQPLRLNWTPRLYVSYCGQRGVTLECVNQVKGLFETEQARAMTLDRAMFEAVDACEKALTETADRGLARLTQALQQAGDCFREWGLTEGSMGTHLRRLQDLGALAVKPTGSGGGGYLLSLWGQEPPAGLQNELIPCFKTPKGP